MVNKKQAIVWDKLAKEYLKQSLNFIKQESPQNALNIKREIKAAIDAIPAYPKRYPTDKYRINNIGNYRALEIYNFRISYFIGNTEIRIVRIRHTGQEPKEY